MTIQVKQWIYAFLACCVCFLSCSEEENVEAGGENAFNIAQNAVIFIQTAGEKKVQVTAPEDWTVSVPEEATGWCSAQRVEDELLISVEKNESVDARTVELDMQCKGMHKTVVVKQAGTAPFIEVTDEVLEKKGFVQALYNQESLQISVVANVPYEIFYGEKVSWIKNVAVSEANGNGESKVTLTLTTNEADADRRTELTFKQQDGDYCAYVTLIQRKDLGAQFDLSEEWFSTEAGEGTVKIVCQIPEDKIFSKIMVEYNHPRKGTNQIEIFERAVMDNIVIKDLLARDGAYQFSVSALNDDEEPLSTDPVTLSAICEPVQPSFKYIDGGPVELTGGNFRADCMNLTNGTVKIHKEPGSVYDNWTDGKYGAEGETIIEINNISTIDGKSPQTGKECIRIRIQIPEEVEVKAFRLRTVQRKGQPSQAPADYTIGVGDENEMKNETDEHIIFTADELKDIQNKNDMIWTSDIIKNEDGNDYIWFYVYDRSPFVPARTTFYINLAEIIILNQIPDPYDPENMTDEEMMKP